MSYSFAEKVYAFTEKNALIFGGSTVVVGVSGGADSMALLHVLSAWRDDLRVVAVHVHHGLRGEEADRDEALVRKFCADNDINYICERANVRLIAQEFGIGEEEAGRRVRYNTFERIRDEQNADVIATAHTADDNVETVLMHVLRGSGIGGLCGIPAKRGRIVRPLLDCTRAEIEAYCAENAIPYIVDSTNNDPTYTRNRVRHQLMPLMREINPSVAAAIARLRSSAMQDEAYFTELASASLANARCADGSYLREEFLRQHTSVRVRMWKALLSENRCDDYTQRHIDALENALRANRGTVYLSGGYSVCVSAGRLKCFSEQQNDNSRLISVDELPFRLYMNGCEHILQCVTREEMLSLQNVHKKFLKFALDYDKIQGGLTIRGRRDGDHFHPAGRNVGKTLKSLFQEMRVPTYDRDEVLLLCDENGIVLMPGVACDSRVCPTDSTKHFLVWLIDGKPSYMLNSYMDDTPHGDKSKE